MILADKIILLRKRNSWSQEELAEKLQISRQSVSKWESGASIPDLDKVIKMSTLFNVSTDYLLKEELEELVAGEGMALGEAAEASGRMVSVEEAEEFLAATGSFAKMIGLGVALCILSPVSLILLVEFAQEGRSFLNGPLAEGAGVGILLIMVALAVVIFILNGIRYKRYEYLEEEMIFPEYGVEGIASKKKEGFTGTFAICIASGVALCILGVVPLAIAGGMGSGELTKCCCAAVLLIMVSVAVYLFIWSGIVYGSFDKLLRAGDYTDENKKLRRVLQPVAGIYWCLATALYLLWSFWGGKWEYTWVLWPIAGILFAVIAQIVKVILCAVQKLKKS